MILLIGPNDINDWKHGECGTRIVLGIVLWIIVFILAGIANLIHN